MAVVVTLANGEQRSWGDGVTFTITADHRLTVRQSDGVLLTCSPTGWLSVSGEARKESAGAASPVSANSGAGEPGPIGDF